MEILQTTELFAPHIHQVKEEDPLTNDYVEGLCDVRSTYNDRHSLDMWPFVIMLFFSVILKFYSIISERHLVGKRLQSHTLQLQCIIDVKRAIDEQKYVAPCSLLPTITE